MADRFDVDGEERPVTSQGRARPSARKRWIRRTLTIAIALGALGGFAAIVLNAWNGGQPPADDKAAPVIKAEPAPTRVRPQTPGGMEVPNQDKQIYGRITTGDGQPQVERLIPPPEANVARPPPPPAPSAAAPVAPLPPPDAAKEAVPEPPAAPPAAAAPEPPKPAAAPSPPPQTAARPPAAGWRVQLAAVRSEEAARKAWADLSKRHADLFGKLDSNVVRADLGQKGVYWRLQAGPVADAAAARALCDRAKQRKVGCIVVKP